MASTTEHFDAYLKWLGIRSAQQPPDHYRLLGIERFESDPDIIATAADRQMAHVRRFQNGPHADCSQRLLNEIAAAKLCLLRDETKSPYDDDLRAEEELRSLQTVAQAARSVRERQDSARFLHADLRRHAQRSGRLLSALACVAIVGFLWLSSSWWSQEQFQDVPGEAAMRAAAGYSKRQPESRPMRVETLDDPEAANDTPTSVPEPVDTEQEIPPRVPDAPANQQSPPAMALAEDQRNTTALRTLTRADTAHVRRAGEHRPAAVDPRRLEPASGTVARNPVATNAQNPNDKVKIALTALETDNTPGVPGTFEQLRRAMSSRDTVAAFTLVNRLKSESRTYQQKDAADRIQLLLLQLEQFWKAVDRGRLLMRPGVELTMDGRKMRVLETQSASIVIQVEDKQYTLATNRRNIEAGLAITLATLHYRRMGASAEAAISAFLAVDKAGDTSKAAEIWRELNRRNMATPLPVPRLNRVDSS